MFAGYAVKNTMENLVMSKTTPLTNKIEAMEQKGNLLICDLWENGTDSVNDMLVLNTEAKSHSLKTLEKCLQEADRAKKKIYLEACLQQHQHFSYLSPPLIGYWLWRRRLT